MKYCVTLFERYKGKVKYWILLNQINCLGGWGEFSSLGLLEGYSKNDVYQALHNQFVACAKATKAAHEISSDLQIGMMLGMIQDILRHVNQKMYLPQHVVIR